MFQSPVLKVGDRFFFHHCKKNKKVCKGDSFTVGKIYKVYDLYEGRTTEPHLRFDDDEGVSRILSSWNSPEYAKLTKVAGD